MLLSACFAADLGWKCVCVNTVEQTEALNICQNSKSDNDDNYSQVQLKCCIKRVILNDYFPRSLAWNGHVKVNTLCWCIEYVHSPHPPAL